MEKQHYFLKRIIFVFLGILIFFGIFYFLFFKAPADFPKNAIFRIEEGANLQSISKNLKEQNFIKSKVLFETIVISLGGERRISKGDYFFERPFSVLEIAFRISESKRNLEQVRITIPEGYNREEIAEAMHAKLPNFNKENFKILTQEKEGFLFPDTYFFFLNENEEDVLKLMSNNFEKKFAPFRSIISDLGKTEKDIIIMASIVEKEAKGENDRATIAYILWKRLSIDMPLQVDIAPETYKTRGLPKSPIANPGLDAIYATIYPESSPYLFYLHSKDGQIYYAKNFDEHRQNIKKYLR